MTKTKPSKARDSYMELISEFPLRPIHTESERDQAELMMGKLAVRNDGALNPGESDYLDVLSDLIAAYDKIHWPMPADDRSPLQRLQHLLQASGTTPTQLRTIFGCSQSLVSLVLNGKRELSKENIKALSKHFAVEPGYFL